jgi:phosphatidate phosphatase
LFPFVEIPESFSSIPSFFYDLDFRECVYAGFDRHGLLKDFVGRPRPDIYARCGYNATFEQCKAAIGDGAEDAFKSWPSGHSSTAMFGGLFAGLVFRGIVASDHLWVAVLGAAFSLLGFWVGATRIRDYRHHPDDVLAGLFVGWVCTYSVWVRAKKRVFARVVDDDGFKQAEP